MKLFKKIREQKKGFKIYKKIIKKLEILLKAGVKLPLVLYLNKETYGKLSTTFIPKHYIFLSERLQAMIDNNGKKLISRIEYNTDQLVDFLLLTDMDD